MAAARAPASVHNGPRRDQRSLRGRLPGAARPQGVALRSVFETLDIQRASCSSPSCRPSLNSRPHRQAPTRTTSPCSTSRPKRGVSSAELPLRVTLLEACRGAMLSPEAHTRSAEREEPRPLDEPRPSLGHRLHFEAWLGSDCVTKGDRTTDTRRADWHCRRSPVTEASLLLGPAEVLEKLRFALARDTMRSAGRAVAAGRHRPRPLRQEPRRQLPRPRHLPHHRRTLRLDLTSGCAQQAAILSLRYRATAHRPSAGIAPSSRR